MRSDCYRRWKSEMIDLKPIDVATVHAILAEHVPECEVRAFGSRATWNAKDYSDLDLAIVGDGPLDWRTLGRLKETFEESNLPMRVDVLDWQAISESFRKVIERDYVVLQEGPKRTGTGEWRKVAFGEVVEFAIGGGWGQETRFPESVGVGVIRGTDFKRILAGDYESVPRRFEKASKAERRELQPGDVILEISGGSRKSNQSTGRSFLVSERHLNRLGIRAIPASFCRLLRFDNGQVD